MDDETVLFVRTGTGWEACNGWGGSGGPYDFLAGQTVAPDHVHVGGEFRTGPAGSCVPTTVRFLHRDGREVLRQSYPAG